MAIRWRSKIILAKLESVYSTDPTPTGAANAILLTDVELRPMEGQDVSRNLDEPWQGAVEQLPAGIHVVLTGSFELAGSGEAGVAPAWGPLLRMAGCAQTIEAETSVEYNPISDAHESGHIYFWIGPTRHVIGGARASCVFSLNAQGIPVGRLTITGLFNTPADVARATPTLTAWQKPKVASSANTPVFTIDGDPFVLRDYTLDLGCDVQPRLLIGSESIQIVDRSELLSCTVEAVSMATYNPYAAAAAMEEVPIVIAHEAAEGRTITIEVPAAVQRRVTGFQNNQGIVEWPLQFTPRRTAGDDQWTLTIT